MLSIADGGSLSHALNSPIDDRLKHLLIERRDQLGSIIWEIAHFVIVQPGDTLSALENTIQFSVFQNPVDGARFGEPGYTPGWEWLADHGHCFEMVWIMDDSGFGHVVIIPKEQGIEPALIDLCTAYASEHA